MHIVNMETDERYHQEHTVVHRRSRGIFLLWLSGILIGAFIASAGAYAYIHYFQSPSIPNDPSASPYYGVFLTNGLAYFGKVSGREPGEIILSDVYYLQQSNDQSGVPFSLARLDAQAYGPTDIVHVNYGQVMLIEQLRKDSQLVSAIAADQK